MLPAQIFLSVKIKHFQVTVDVIKTYIITLYIIKQLILCVTVYLTLQAKPLVAMTKPSNSHDLYIVGSIVVTFVIDGSTTDVNATAYSMCDSISNSTSYTFDGYDMTL